MVIKNKEEREARQRLEVISAASQMPIITSLNSFNQANSALVSQNLVLDHSANLTSSHYADVTLPSHGVHLSDLVYKQQHQQQQQGFYCNSNRTSENVNSNFNTTLINNDGSTNPSIVNTLPSIDRKSVV